MDLTNMKKGICTLKLESLKKVYNAEGQVDDSLVNAIFSIIDFSISGNRQVVPKDVCLASAYTLKHKPLLCQYFATTDYNNPNDSFGTHGEYIGKLRNGEEYIFTNTHAIGVSEKEGYLGVIKDENGNDQDVLLASFMLWKLRYPNEISLINEFYENNEPLYTSCEYYYSTFTEKTDENGSKYDEVTGQILFDGHCCLGTNIAPAYDSSKLISFNNKWNKALNERKFNQNQNQETDIDINNKLNNQKEDEVMAEMFKKVCELSFDDIRALIYGQLKGVLSENEYDYSWISDVYETYFILSYWNDDTHKYYKVSYTKVEEVITIDWENRNEVYLYQEWREIPEVQQVLNSITEKDDTIKTLNSTIETLTTEKEGLTVKFNEATDSITELSKQVNEMKPIVETYNNAQTEKALNDQKVKFEEKFVALNAKAKFDTDEVQDLIKKSINNTEEGKAAILSLNSILVDLVKPVKETKEVKEFNSREMKNLIDTKDSFESRYFV